jgi:large subunit ribosomal protein L9
MEIILKQDVKNLGYANDMVKVKSGYARNFLIPKGFAIVADASNKKIHAENMKQKAHKEDKHRKEAEILAQTLEAITLKIGAKAGTSGKIFGSVNTIQIAEAIKEQYKYDIDRKKIELEGDSIKQLGEYKATISLYKGIKAVINFEVVAE